MKRILTILLSILLLGGGNYSCTAIFAAEETQKIEASIQFDWVNMEQVKRNEKIESVKIQLFGPEGNFNIKRKDFRSLYKDYLKDTNVKTHYRLISNGAEESNNYNLSGFYRKLGNSEVLYSYAIQPKLDLRRVYYYSAMGRLAYVDEISANYPDFPYYSKQYRTSGKLAGAIYFEDRDLQYVYKPNGKFAGVWFKEKMFDKNGKEILTRTNW